MKKVIAFGIATLMMLAMVACGGNPSSIANESAPSAEQTGEPANSQDESLAAQVDLSDIKIGIIGQQETGDVPKAIRAYMDGLKAAFGLNYEYVAGSSYDEQTNITTVQNLISSGCNGIIMCMDSGMAGIMEECTLAGVYVAGFLNEMPDSLAFLQDMDYFLGTIADGAADRSAIGEKAAELAIADGLKNIGVVSFPLNYFPQNVAAIDSFTAAIDAYNSTAGADEQITVFDTEQLSFSPLEQTYFATNPEIDGIFSLAATFVYPTMVAAGRTDVKLYTTGYNLDDEPAFREGVIGMMTQCSYESILYPVALICNAIRGVEYADQPAVAQAEDCSLLFFTSVEELDAYVDNSYFYTADYSKALITAEDFAQMLPFVNEGATYAGLVQAVNSVGMDALMQ